MSTTAVADQLLLFPPANSSTEAQFNDSTGVTVDSSSNVYVADLHNCRILKIAFK